MLFILNNVFTFLFSSAFLSVFLSIHYSFSPLSFFLAVPAMATGTRTRARAKCALVLASSSSSSAECRTVRCAVPTRSHKPTGSGRLSLVSSDMGRRDLGINPVSQ